MHLQKSTPARGICADTETKAIPQPEETRHFREAGNENQALLEAYSSEDYALEWTGLCAHSPLRETVGYVAASASIGTPEPDETPEPAAALKVVDEPPSGPSLPVVPVVIYPDRSMLGLSPAELQFKEILDEYAELFSGRENVPEDLVERAR
ncbi:hypothetical protein B0A55_10136 [Friedmanniomyces simplex]|uniref:Uncharacterized protein n=1 Tax=Friedmanniomyces simplex TaxID=329884 RepID=A0A4U0WXJ1_9PEZI|nr:hypothetical protein B0A55_10136 [Friedmanniomyces simplex]